MTTPLDLEALRDEFPAVRDTLFLGAHTLGPLSRRVRAAVERFLELWAEEPSAERLWFHHIIPELRRLEASYARLIGADPDEVTVTPSVTTGLASIASALRFDERDEVVLSRDEFPTDCHVWLGQERHGARVVWVEGHGEAAYLDAVGERTAVVSASRVSYLDGAALDAARLAAGCAEAEALLVIDDYHGSGVVPIDVHAARIPVLVGGSLKYLLGGPGVAFLFVRRDVIPTLEPTLVGWFGQDDFFAFENSRLDRPADARRFALGTPSPTAIYAAAAGLDLIHEIGPEVIAARVRHLTGLLIDAAQARGWTVRTPREPQRRGGLVAIEVPDSEAVLERLLDRRVIVDQRRGALRVCPHAYTTEDELERFLDALDEVVG